MGIFICMYFIPHFVLSLTLYISEYQFLFLSSYLSHSVPCRTSSGPWRIIMAPVPHISIKVRPICLPKTTPKDLLVVMDANRVERTVLVQVIHYRWDNSYVAHVIIHPSLPLSLLPLALFSLLRFAHM